jgi:hypothetical protein
MLRSTRTPSRDFSNIRDRERTEICIEVINRCFVPFKALFSCFLVRELAVDRRWVPSLGGFVLLGVFARCAIVECTIKVVSSRISSSANEKLTQPASASTANPFALPSPLSSHPQSSLSRLPFAVGRGLAVRGVRGVWRLADQICFNVSL